MRTVGFPISTKENEFRRALLPTDLPNVRHPEQLFFEEGYGSVLGISDDEYRLFGCGIVTHENTLQMDIVCDPKIGDADYLEELNPGQSIFGWVHAVQNRDITDALLSTGVTAVAWEDMFEDGRHSFWRNNEIAGEAAIMHAFQCYGKMPYGMRVALLGRGNVANGALKILTLLGASVTIYNRATEGLFRKELDQFEVVVNAILWDTSRTDHIIYASDLQRMRLGALIIDISCDAHGGIETCEPTTIEKPTYVRDGIVHYAVDHTPSLFYKTATEGLSRVVSAYIDELIEGNENEVLSRATIIKDGKIIDSRISDYQHR